MGQQESHAGALQRPASEPGAPEQPEAENAPSASGTGSTYPEQLAAADKRSRMDKLFRRAQSTLEAKIRNRRGGGDRSPGGAKSKKDKKRDSSTESSLETTPVPTPSMSHGSAGSKKGSTDSGSRDTLLTGSKENLHVWTPSIESLDTSRSGASNKGSRKSTTSSVASLEQSSEYESSSESPAVHVLTGQGALGNLHGQGHISSGSKAKSEEGLGHSRPISGVASEVIVRSFEQVTTTDGETGSMIGLVGKPARSHESSPRTNPRTAASPGAFSSAPKLSYTKVTPVSLASFPGSPDGAKRPKSVLENGSPTPPRSPLPQGEGSGETTPTTPKLGRPPPPRTYPQPGSLSSQESRPEEMGSYLAPLVTNEDLGLGLSPIEEKSETMSVYSKSSEDTNSHHCAAHSNASLDKKQSKLVTSKQTPCESSSAHPKDPKSFTLEDSKQHVLVGVRPKSEILDISKYKIQDRQQQVGAKRQPKSVPNLPSHAAVLNGASTDPVFDSDGDDETVRAADSSVKLGDAESSEELPETSPEDYRADDGDKSQHHYLTLPGSGASSVLSSPDDLFTDARSPVETPYVSASERRDSTKSGGDSGESVDETQERPRGFAHSPKHRSRRDRDSNLHKGKSASLDDLETGEAKETHKRSPKASKTTKSHKTVEARYGVATSRLLSASSDSGNSRPRHASMTASLDSSYWESAPETEADLIRKTTGSDQNLEQVGGQSGSPLHKPGQAKLSMSVDSGLETAGDKKDMVTSINDARFDFARQVFLLREGNKFGGESSMEQESEGEVFGERRKAWEDSDSNGEGPAQRPYKFSAQMKGRPRRMRFTSENSYLVSPGGDSTPPAPSLRRPPSRSVSFDQVVCRPENVPEKLDFKKLEKFEGTNTHLTNCYKIAV